MAAGLVLSGCVAEMVQKNKPRKGPVPEVGVVDPGGGEVRYSTEGWSFVVSLRRFTAVRRMKAYCAKGFEAQVTQEFSHDDVEVSYASDDMDTNFDKGLEHYNVAPYRHIAFDCKPLAGKKK